MDCRTCWHLMTSVQRMRQQICASCSLRHATLLTSCWTVASLSGSFAVASLMSTCVPGSRCRPSTTSLTPQPSPISNWCCQSSGTAATSQCRYVIALPVPLLPITCWQNLETLNSWKRIWLTTQITITSSKPTSAYFTTWCACVPTVDRCSDRPVRSPFYRGIFNVHRDSSALRPIWYCHTLSTNRRMTSSMPPTRTLPTSYTSCRRHLTARITSHSCMRSGRQRLRVVSTTWRSTMAISSGLEASVLLNCTSGYWEMVAVRRGVWLQLVCGSCHSMHSIDNWCSTHLTACRVQSLYIFKFKSFYLHPVGETHSPVRVWHTESQRDKRGKCRETERFKVLMFYHLFFDLRYTVLSPSAIFSFAHKFCINCLAGFNQLL